MLNEALAERIAVELKRRNVAFEEKRMFGGVAFMVDDKMCVGINNDALMVRLDPEIYEESLKKKGVREMDFTKRPMKGFIYVEENGLETDKELGMWIGLALELQSKSKIIKKEEKIRSKNYGRSSRDRNYDAETWLVLLGRDRDERSRIL